MKSLFVKKYISEKEWKEDYQFTIDYYNLGKDESRKRDKIKLSFLVADINSDGKPPVDCEILTDDEALDLDNQRRRLRHYPFVTEDYAV